jgi:hypothetical protein
MGSSAHSSLVNDAKSLSIETHQIILHSRKDQQDHEISVEIANPGGAPVEIQNPLGYQVGLLSAVMLNISVRPEVLTMMILSSDAHM